MEGASSASDGNDRRQPQQVQSSQEEETTATAAAPTQQQQQQQQQQQHEYLRYKYKYDAGDAIILHGLIQNTNVNGRRGVVHYSSSADYGFPGGGNINVLANNNNNNDNNNDNNNANNENDDDHGEQRCMVRLLPRERSNSNNNGNNNNNGNSNNGTEGDDNDNNAGGGGRCVISVKTKNLTLDYPPGQRVLLRGLVGAKHLNGRVATVVSFRNGKRAKRFLVEVAVRREDDDRVANNNNNNNGGGKDRNGSSTAGEKLSLVEGMNASADSKMEGGAGRDRGDVRRGKGGDVASDEEPEVKQILVSPKNIIHLPGTKPPPISPLDQRFVFSGSMPAVVRLLNQSVHKSMTPRDVLEGNGLDLLSRDRPEDMAEISTAARLWGKIQQRSYKCRGGADDDDDRDGPIREDGNDLPPFYQRLVPTSPSHGRTHKVCFNPGCHATIPPGTHRRMKRCTKCHSVAYCNRECASAAWGHHRRACRTMREEGVRFAECVTLTSPRWDEVVEAQRMARRCVGRIAAMDDPAGHFERMGRGGEGAADAAATAKLLYDAMTRGGTDVANEILLHLENPPPVNGEVTVAVGFNSLGHDAIFSRSDIQLFANIYDCTVTYQVLNQDCNARAGTTKGAVEDITLEPNGEEIRMPNHGGMPEDVQEGFLNFINNLMPGVAGPMNHGGDGAAPVFHVPPGMDDANNAAPDAGVDNNDQVGGGGAAADNNGANAAVANFLNHVMNEAGVGDFGNGNTAGNNNNAADDDNDDDGSVLDENLPSAEDVADVSEDAGGEQPQQERGGDGGFQFNFPGGGAHIHVAQVNGNLNGEGNLPPGVPMPPPGAFFQMPGMPVGVQVAVAEARADFPGDGNDGMMGGMPPAGAFQPIPGMPGGFHAMHAGPFPMAPGGDGAQVNQGPQAVAGAIPEFAAAVMEAGVFGMPPEGEDTNVGIDEVEEEAEMEIED